MITGPAFVGPHAVERFQQRIHRVPYDEARETILEGLASGVRSVTRPKKLDGNSASVHVRCAVRGLRFVATVLFGDRSHGPLPVVVTVRSWMRGTSAGRGRPRRPDREKWTTAEERSRTWTTKDGRAIPIGRRFEGRPWTPEEDEAIRASLGRESLAVVGARIGRTKSAVRYRRWKLGIEPDGSRWMRRWTPEEEQRAVDLLTTKTKAEIGQELGRSRRAVEQHLCRIHQHARNQDLLTSGQAAEACGLSAQYLTELARAGRVKAQREPGGRWWLFDPEGLEGISGRSSISLDAG